MLTFILKGIYRDRSRSLFPVIVCCAGVCMVFFGCCFLEGSLENFIRSNAVFSTGHVKIVSHAYGQVAGGNVLELALETDEDFLPALERDCPQLRWTRRVHFGGLLDIPDEAGETKAQSPVAAMAFDLLSPTSVEVAELRLEECLRQGRLPAKADEILVSAHLAERLAIGLNERATILSSTVDGASTAGNFIVVGFITFGIPMLDRATVVMDIAGAHDLLGMEGYTAEILGFLRGGFDRAAVEALARQYNQRQDALFGADEYRPHMLTLMDQNNLRMLLDRMAGALGFMVGLFCFLMTLVLWNAGLISGIRRFSEVGVRLAIGERRRHIVGSMLLESLATGIVGTILGIVLGLPIAYYFQEVGVDYTDSIKDFSMMMSGIMRAKITVRPFVFAIIPGIGASFFGMLMATIAIYQRKTARLFKELET